MTRTPFIGMPIEFFQVREKTPQRWIAISQECRFDVLTFSVLPDTGKSNDIAHASATWRQASSPLHIRSQER